MNLWTVYSFPNEGLKLYSTEVLKKTAKFYTIKRSLVFGCQARVRHKDAYLSPVECLKAFAARKDRSIELRQEELARDTRDRDWAIARIEEVRSDENK